MKGRSRLWMEGRVGRVERGMFAWCGWRRKIGVKVKTEGPPVVVCEASKW